MFFMVCVSTATSSVRIGCPSAIEAKAKLLELEATGLGKVRVFDGSGNRILPDQLETMVATAPSDTRDPSSSGRNEAGAAREKSERSF